MLPSQNQYKSSSLLKLPIETSQEKPHILWFITIQDSLATGIFFSSLQLLAQIYCTQ